MGGAVQSFSSPMLAEGMQNGLSGFGTSGIATFADGGFLSAKEKNEMRDIHHRTMMANGGQTSAIQDILSKYGKNLGASSLDEAKIYVADLAEYNNGKLVGKWLELSDYSSGAEVMEAIQEMLDEQTKNDKDGEVHEEYAIHDFQGFPRSFYSESMGESDFDKIYEIANTADGSNLPIDVLMEAVSDLGYEDDPERVAEAFFSKMDASMGNQWREFAYEFVDAVGGVSGVSNAEYYFDYDAFGSDARMDFTDEDLQEYGYDELDDTELGEQLVDEVGGVQGLGESALQTYFDYSRLGDDLEDDFIVIRGKDGDFYFFNRNFAKGGQFKMGGDVKKSTWIAIYQKGSDRKILEVNGSSLEEAKLQAEVDKKRYKIPQEMFLYDIYRKYAEGGDIAKSNYEMMLSQAKEVQHHTTELQTILKKEKDIDAWVVAKMENVSSTLSDITHYLDGKTEYAKGGKISDELVEYSIPTWAVSSLINADDSGLEDEDIEKINKFVDKVVATHGNAFFMLGEKSEESNFEFYNDIDRLGSDVTILYIRPSEKYAKGGEVMSEIKSKYVTAGMDSEGIWTYSKTTADEIAKKYNGDVQQDGSKWYVSLKKYAKGGKIGFQGLAKKVAKRYVGKKVSKEYQAEYGKTYDAKEAKEVGNKVAGKVYQQQVAKKKIVRKLQRKSK